MSDHDVVVGASQDTIDKVLSSLFDILKPTGFFEFSIDIDAAGFKKARFSVVASPTVSLKTSVPSQIKDDVVKTAMNSLGQDSPNSFALAGVLSEVGKTTFNISFPTVQVRLFFESSAGSPEESENIVASLNVVAGLQLDTSVEPVIATFKGLKAAVDMEDKKMKNIVNMGMIPHFLPVLNEKVLVPIGIPMLKILGVEMTVPMPVVEDGFLVAYSSLGRVPPMTPAVKASWPGNGIFACVDSDLISQVATQAIKGRVNKENQSFGKLSIFEGTYSLSFGTLKNVVIHENGSLSASGNIGVNLRITVNHGLPFFPNPSFDLGAYGSVGITAKARVQSGHILGRIDSIDHFSFDFNLGAKPWAILPGLIEKAIDAEIGNLRNQLVDGLLKPKMEAELANHDLPLTEMPPIDIPLGPGIEMMLEDVQMTSETSTGNTYLMAYGMPSITKK